MAGLSVVAYGTVGTSHYALLSNKMVVQVYNIITTNFWVGRVWEPNHTIDHSSITSSAIPEELFTKFYPKGYSSGYHGALTTRRKQSSEEYKQLDELERLLIRQAFAIPAEVGRDTSFGIDFIGDPVKPEFHNV